MGISDMEFTGKFIAALSATIGILWTYTWIKELNSDIYMYGVVVFMLILVIQEVYTNDWI